jgi:hypothetical protein
VDLDLEQMLSRADAELESAESELQAIQQRLEELRAIKRGVKLAMQRYGSDITGSSPPMRDANQATTNGDEAPRSSCESIPAGGLAAPLLSPDAPHGDLCIEVLRVLKRPASSLQVRDHLMQRGRELDAEQVRNAFQYMLKRGRVVRTEPGVWALPEHTSPNRQVLANRRV